MLLAESQRDLATAIQEWFSKNHFWVEVTNDGLQAEQLLREKQYDVILLEIALPRMDGISVVRSCRAGGASTPILLIAGRHSSQELQTGLDAGADGYLVKPFLLSDIAAQVRALLRRPALRTGQLLTVSNIAIDTGAGRVTKDEKEIHLLPMEFSLLEFLLRHRNQIFSPEALFERVWPDNSRPLLDTVRTHIKTLRHKIDSPDRASIITTVRGQGYKI
jgi:DNA-binding response OmpR family regulator